MSFFTLNEELSQFNAQLKDLQNMFQLVYKMKLIQDISIKHCQFNGDSFVLNHPELVNDVISITEDQLKNLDIIKSNVINGINKRNKDKKINELNFSINLWKSQTDANFIAEKLALIENWSKELDALK